MNDLAGAVVWAVVPFVPEAPFRIYAGEERAPITLPDAARLVEAAGHGDDAQFTFLVPGKARPVLIVSDAQHDSLRELLALRLLRLSKIDEAERTVIRRQESPTHYHLDPERFSELPEENAAMIASLVRVHATAIGSRPLGRLDRQELGVVQQRMIRHNSFDVRMLVREELRLLAERRERRSQ